MARRKEAGEEVAEAVFLAGSGDVAFVERSKDPGLGGGHGRLRGKKDNLC